MLFVHQNNLDTKIAENYHGIGRSIEDFKNNYYANFHAAMLSLDFTNPSMNVFIDAAGLLNDYYRNLCQFINQNGITSQSKLESTLLEELSVYLFKDIDEVKTGKLDFYNKGIFAGLKINSNLTLDIIKKDVDFCIGRKMQLTIQGQQPVSLTIPLVSVEVKTYLDATMFGEVKSSSKSLKSANPNSKAYVLMGYKCLADEHILAARQDSTLDEMFVLREGKGKLLDPYALYLYWEEITAAIKSVTTNSTLQVPGRLLMCNDMYKRIIDEHTSP